MERIVTTVRVKDGTSKAQIIKALKELEESRKVNVAENHHFIMVDFDGIAVTKWHGDVNEFIKTPATRTLLSLIFFNIRLSYRPPGEKEV